VTALAPTLQAFFTSRLIGQRGASEHTVAAYRDIWRLLLGFAAQRTGKNPSQLDITDLDAPLIAVFLDHLEHDRGNSPRTRSSRLTAIHSISPGPRCATNRSDGCDSTSRGRTRSRPRTHEARSSRSQPSGGNAMTTGGAITGLAEAITLDWSSPVPLYFHLAQAVERAVSTGRLPPGTRLDNEFQLTDQLGLSRPTVRQAMQYLSEKGIIVRRRGVGTHVVQPKVRRPLELASLYDDLQQDGQEPATRVLSLGLVPTSDAVTGCLKVRPGSLILCAERLRSAHGQPIAIMTNYLPEGLISPTQAELEETGLYQLLREAGVTLHSATQSIGARNATPHESQLLEEKRAAALLTMTRTACDDRGLAVEYGTHVYAASRYNFELNLTSTKA
jgi:GntR family transcriptional regulator